MTREEKNLFFEEICKYGYDDFEDFKFLFSSLNDEKQLKKMLIGNKFGILGNLVYKYRNEIFSDKEFILELVKRNSFVFHIFNDYLNLDNDKEFMLEVVKYYDNSLRFASDRLKNDKDVVMAVIKNDKYALEYISYELMNDKEFILEAIKINSNAIHYVGNKLLNDQDIIKIRKAILILDYD